MGAAIMIPLNYGSPPFAIRLPSFGRCLTPRYQDILYRRGSARRSMRSAGLEIHEPHLELNEPRRCLR